MRIAAALGLALLLPQEGATRLAWKLEKGAAFTYVLEAKVLTEFQGLEMTQDYRYRIEFACTAVDEAGAASLTGTFLAVRAKAVGLMNVDYDSERDKERPTELMGKLLHGLHGKAIELKMTPTGEVTALSGYRKLARDAMKDEPDGGGMRSVMVEQFFADDYFRGVLQGAMGLLPGEPVARGGAWEKRREQPIPFLGKLGLTEKSTLKEWKDSEATIALGVEAVMKEGSDGPMSGAELTKGAGTGEFVFDTAAGRLTRSKTETRLDMDVNGDEFVSTTVIGFRREK